MSQQTEATIVITENIEKAFIFVGGQDSKDLYDSRIIQAERQRILEGIRMIEVRALETRTMLFQDNLLALIRKMIKGKDE